MSHQPQVPSPAETLYLLSHSGVTGSPKEYIRSKSALRLADAQANAPQRVGLLVIDTVEQGEESYTAVNGQLDPKEVEKLQPSGKVGDFTFPRSGGTVINDDVQNYPRTRPRIPLLYRGGEAASIAGTVGAGGYELMEASGSAGNGFTYATLAAGGLLMASRWIDRRRHTKHATAALRLIAEQAVDPEHGAVLVPQDTMAFYIPPRSPLPERYKFSEAEGWLIQKNNEAATENEPRNDPADLDNFSISSSRSAKQYIYIRPSGLVGELLKRAQDPQKLWFEDGLQEQAQTMADLCRVINNSEKDLSAAQRRLRLSNIDTGEVDTMSANLEAARRALTDVAIEAVDGMLKRHAQQTVAIRIRNSENQLAALAGPDIKMAHPLELSLQTFHSVVAKSLGSSDLDLERESTHRLVASAKQYLQEARESLTVATDQSQQLIQLQQLYEGFYKQFAQWLPNLPTWNDVADDFTNSLV